MKFSDPDWARQAEARTSPQTPAAPSTPSDPVDIAPALDLGQKTVGRVNADVARALGIAQTLNNVAKGTVNPAKAAFDIATPFAAQPISDLLGALTGPVLGGVSGALGASNPREAMAMGTAGLGTGTASLLGYMAFGPVGGIMGGLVGGPLAESAAIGGIGDAFDSRQFESYRDMLEDRQNIEPGTGLVEKMSYGRVDQAVRSGLREDPMDPHSQASLADPVGKHSTLSGFFGFLEEKLGITPSTQDIQEHYATVGIPGKMEGYQHPDREDGATSAPSGPEIEAGTGNEAETGAETESDTESEAGGRGGV